MRRLTRAVLILFLLGWAGTYGHGLAHDHHDETVECGAESHWACGGCDEEDGHHHHHPSKSHAVSCPVCAGANAVEAPAFLSPPVFRIERASRPASVAISESLHAGPALARGPPPVGFVTRID